MKSNQSLIPQWNQKAAALTQKTPLNHQGFKMQSLIRVHKRNLPVWDTVGVMLSRGKGWSRSRTAVYKCCRSIRPWWALKIKNWNLSFSWQTRACFTLRYASLNESQGFIHSQFWSDIPNTDSLYPTYNMQILQVKNHFWFILFFHWDSYLYCLLFTKRRY